MSVINFVFGLVLGVALGIVVSVMLMVYELKKRTEYHKNKKLKQ